MLKIEFGFGTGYRSDGVPLDPSDVSFGLAKINEKAVELFGGFTIFQTYGGWVDPETGSDVREVGRCLVVYVSVSEGVGESIDSMVGCIKTALRQKAVAVCVTRVTSEIH